ncbi:MAG: SCP2 sterol-binding domain-containing protein [Proteobacteria bacterium]|jgi:ubiquinone biosynthesis accessory factor UbiJ|nr:SCP2 sterol-binding domain-containing protein [Pseudomonadota bacterium]
MSLAAETATGITAALETALNKTLRLDPDTFARLGDFSGKVIAIELHGFDLTLYLLPGPDGINLMTRYAGQPDTVMAGTPLAMARMALGPDASQVLFSGDVTIRGDVETGQRFKHLLDQLDIDWEELLSRLTGDVVAHKLGNLLRSTADWGQDALGILGDNTAEYLQQEAYDLPTPEATREFLQDVDCLRDDVARLEARLSRLRRDSGEE